MRPNTPAADAPLDDELLPPSSMASMLNMPTSRFASTIDGEKASEVAALFADEPVDPPARSGLLSRIGLALFGR